MPEVDEQKTEPEVCLVRFYEEGGAAILSAFVDIKVAKAIPYNVKTQNFSDFRDIGEAQHIIRNNQVYHLVIKPVTPEIYTRFRANTISI